MESRICISNIFFMLFLIIMLMINIKPWINEYIYIFTNYLKVSFNAGSKNHCLLLFIERKNNNIKLYKKKSMFQKAIYLYIYIRYKVEVLQTCNIYKNFFVKDVCANIICISKLLKDRKIVLKTITHYSEKHYLLNSICLLGALLFSFTFGCIHKYK